MKAAQMTTSYHQLLEALTKMGGGEIFSDALRGVEKESLRVTHNGEIAKTPHPQSLGSALTHSYITTDYSEAQLEFVTPPYANNWQVIQALTDLHKYTVQSLSADSGTQPELIWPASMPCMVGDENDVPVASFGTSNVGQMKHVYRLGLGHRYGRIMQTISGVHFNFSIPERFWPIYKEFKGRVGIQSEEFISEEYFHILRNLRRASWILLYLFGNSPSLCASFKVDTSNLQEMNQSFYLPYATSLRMSDIGYKNDSQSSIHVSANSLDEYIHDLSAAMNTPYPAYNNIGVKVNGEYRQLNTNLLQIENEYYSLIRPKRVARSGEKPTEALRRAGVQYLEVRALDNSIFDPVGVNSDELYFLELLIWYCLFYPSRALSKAEEQANSNNQLLVAKEGRKPGLKLTHHGVERELKEWATSMCSDMKPLARILDQGSPDPERALYSQALAAQQLKISDPQTTPSARILTEMEKTGASFHQLSLDIANAHREYFQALQLSKEKEQYFVKIANKSLEKQKTIEGNDTISFDEYLEQYFAK